MAKRKRLSPALLSSEGDAPETKAALGWVGHGTRRAPIADVTGDAAQQSAFEEVAEELRSARAEGRMVLRLPLSAIEVQHLVRDRMVADPEDMDALKDSLRARGQQTPAEVVDLGGGRYGLISGWRRMLALQALAAEEDAESFGFIQVLVRRPETAAEAYRAMVEENEIRADLSFYERAHIAVQAVAQGIYPDMRTAVQSLFAAARAPKRSKIMAFTRLVAELDDVLRFPVAVPEKAGLALAAALQEDPGFAARLTAALAEADPQSATEERSVLDAALRPEITPKRPSARAQAASEPVSGVTLTEGRGRITLSGRGVDAALLADLRAWLAARSQS